MKPLWGYLRLQLPSFVSNSGEGGVGSGFGGYSLPGGRCFATESVHDKVSHSTGRVPNKLYVKIPRPAHRMPLLLRAQRSRSSKNCA